MYCNFYNLVEEPFNLTPDSHFLFHSKKHKDALAHILFGLQAKKGFILITGEIGAGKTTVCRALVKELDKHFRIALVLNPMLSPTELLKTITDDLGIPYKGRSRQAMIGALYDFLLKGEETIIIIDESQNLSPTAMEQIRMLGNLETEKTKLLQLVLVGQPELRSILQKEKLKQLNQRIAVRYHLEALNIDETSQYIYYRLNIAGAQGKIWFHPNAIERIYHHSRGIPRIINIICDYSLMAGYVDNSWSITKDMVDRAIAEYEGISTESLMAEKIKVG